MPKIYEYFGIIFLFYSHEHLPVHVHAQYQEYESRLEFVFENGKLIEIKVRKVKGRNPLPENKLREAKSFVRKYYSAIASKWTDFFVLKKKIKSEKINKRIR